jgi:hypothetical protein
LDCYATAALIMGGFFQTRHYDASIGRFTPLANSEASC